MLEQLFGSRTRVKLLRLFLSHPDTSHYVRELTRTIDERINSVRRELDNLSAMGLLDSEFQDKKKYYKVRKDYVLYRELRNLVLKTHVSVERDLFQKVQQAGNIEYFILTGVFTDSQEDTQVDILLVGDLDKLKLTGAISEFEKDFKKEIRYTVMSQKEFVYRRDVTDRFLYDILNSKKVVLVDNFNKEEEK